MVKASRWGRTGAGWRVAKGEEMGTSVIVLTIKTFLNLTCQKTISGDKFSNIYQLLSMNPNVEAYNENK